MDSMCAYTGRGKMYESNSAHECIEFTSLWCVENESVWQWLTLVLLAVGPLFKFGQKQGQDRRA